MRASCTVCGIPSVARKLCRTHYQRWFRHGTTADPVTVPLQERFEALFERRTADECWPWLGTKDKGYGRFGVDGRSVPAHRVAYALYCTSIPDGHEIDHVKSRGCKSTLCVNPAHLEPVTGAENLRREAEGIPLCRRGIHPDTPENTMHTTNGRRRCRACKKAWTEANQTAGGTK